MNTILAAWREVRMGARSLTSFCAVLAAPATEDAMDDAGDADWDAYGDLMDLAGRYVEELMDADVFAARVEAVLREVETPPRYGRQ
ncbi:MAG: hypothetical protein WBA46_18605 [Thermomicrobiales bacterium]